MSGDFVAVFDLHPPCTQVILAFGEGIADEQFDCSRAPRSGSTPVRHRGGVPIRRSSNGRVELLLSLTQALVTTLVGSPADGGRPQNRPLE